MKLAQRLGVVLCACIIGVVSAAGALRVKRELDLIELETRDELHTIGAALKPAFVHTAEHEGFAAAQALLDATAAELLEGRSVRVRWVPADAAQPLPGPAGVERSEDAATLRLPVAPANGPAGALELVRPLERERAFIAQTITSVVLTVIALVVLLEIAVLLAGRSIVGRPLARLAEQARRIGKGELTARVETLGHDEIALVAAEMNAMAEALERSQKAVADEHRQRLSALEELRHADRLATVGELAAGVAHQLGTPLTVVANRARRVAAGGSQEHVAKAAQIIVRQVERITAVVRQLLDFARREAGPKQRGDVVGLARQALDLVAPMAVNRGVRLVLDAPAGPVEANYEANPLEQALTNLVVNAVQAMARGGTLTVQVTAERLRPPGPGLPEDDYVRIAVHDEGCGIAPENLAHVFDPFFTTKPVGEGTGLGLSVAYGIAREHGGWIDATSVPGEGSRFVLHLPRARA